MFCEKCEKKYEKVPGKKMSRCKDKACRRDLKYSCSNCSQRFKSYSTLCFHLKTNKCPGLPNFNPLLNIKKQSNSLPRGKNQYFHYIDISIQSSHTI